MAYKNKIAREQRISYEGLRTALRRDIEDWLGIGTEEELTDDMEANLRNRYLLEIRAFIDNLTGEVNSKQQKNTVAVALGSVKSETKAKAARENGKKGGRLVTKSK